MVLVVVKAGPRRMKFMRQFNTRDWSELIPTQDMFSGELFPGLRLGRDKIVVGQYLGIGMNCASCS